MGYLPNFEGLPIPFACTATSLCSMKTEILHSGPVPAAVRASMTVPVLFQPCHHEGKRLLVDGGVFDWAGTRGLSVLPKQPDRTLHIVVNRRMPLLSHFERTVPPSELDAKRSSVVTVRLNNPPTLFLGDASFQSFGKAIVDTG